MNKIKIANIHDKKKIPKSFQIPISKRAETARSIAYQKKAEHK